MKTIALILSLSFSSVVMAEMIKVHVPKMTCQMCVKAMNKGFQDSVKNPETDILVDLETKVVTLNTNKDLSDKMIKAKVESAGYHVEKITRGKEKKQI